jgi:hypothetical protein
MKVPDDVLTEDPLRADFSDDPGDIRPKMARVCCAELFACRAERLARVARSEDIHAATPRSAVEGSQVRPERR